MCLRHSTTLGAPLDVALWRILAVMLAATGHQGVAVAKPQSARSRATSARSFLPLKASRPNGSLVEWRRSVGWLERTTAVSFVLVLFCGQLRCNTSPSCSAFSGGYLYSVCPASTPLTEDCLQAHPLSFVGSNHTIRYLDGRPDISIPAMDVSQGTTPAGSSWRRNPIPACNCDKGFGCKGVNGTNELKSYANDPAPSPVGFDCPTGTQFPVPFPYGYGQQVWNLKPPKAGLAADTWVIVDRVRVPEEVGDYVLRWRW